MCGGGGGDSEGLLFVLIIIIFFCAFCLLKHNSLYKDIESIVKYKYIIIIN